MMFTLMVYDMIHGVVDISTPCADIFESIMLHKIVARKLGLLMTLPHPVQGMYIVHAPLDCVPRWWLCPWALPTQGTYQNKFL